MISKRINKRKKAAGNRGFSLVELIISITILVLVMLPLMNSFYRSALLNKKAKETQEQSDLAANIMEGLRNLNIDETISQFIGVDTFNMFNLNGAVIKALLDSGGVRTEITPAPASLSDYYTAVEGQTAYNFAIYGINAGGTAYDALITMNPTAYAETSGILNDYPMPDAINLDIMANGLLFSDGRAVENGVSDIPGTYDNDALETFYQLGYDYAENQYYQSDEYLAALDAYRNACETAEVLLSPAPAEPSALTFNPAVYPRYCDKDTLKKYITKTMKITVQNTVSYNLDYTCIWPDGCTLNNTLQIPISTVSYASPVENIYLFYGLPVFVEHPDIIEFNNQTANNINFYLAKQAGVTTLPYIDVKILAGDVTVFTNIKDAVGNVTTVTIIDSSSVINPDIINTSKKDRIFNTEIRLYKYVDSGNIADKFKDLVYTISSATENAQK